MRSKDPRTMEKIIEFVQAFRRETDRSPSTTEISGAVGIARGTVYKYLIDMRDRGMIEYDVLA